MVYGPYSGVDFMSTLESTPAYLPWATLCQSRLYPQSGSKNLASGTGTYASFDTSVTLFFTPQQNG
jgi:hypothetical protein